MAGLGGGGRLVCRSPRFSRRDALRGAVHGADPRVKLPAAAAAALWHSGPDRASGQSAVLVYKSSFATRLEKLDETTQFLKSRRGGHGRRVTVHGRGHAG